MMNGSLDKGTIQYRSGTSFARGMTIDLALTEAETKVLYEKWNSDKWGLPYEFPGNQVAITCEMVRDVPLTDLVSVYGKKFAARLMDVAQKNSVL